MADLEGEQRQEEATAGGGLVAGARWESKVGDSPYRGAAMEE